MSPPLWLCSSTKDPKGARDILVHTGPHCQGGEDSQVSQGAWLVWRHLRSYRLSRTELGALRGPKAGALTDS